jgi:hypothetical protein
MLSTNIGYVVQGALLGCNAPHDIIGGQYR